MDFYYKKSIKDIFNINQSNKLPIFYQWYYGIKIGDNNLERIIKIADSIERKINIVDSLLRKINLGDTALEK